MARSALTASYNSQPLFQRATISFDSRRKGFAETKLSVVASPPADVHIDGVKLEQCASITLQPTTQPASVKVLRSGDPNAKWISLAPGIKTSLAAGIYQVAIELPGKSYSTGIRLEAGRNLDFAPIDEPTNAHCGLQNPDGIAVQGDWMKAKNTGGVLYLSRGCVNVNLVFAKPKSSILGRKHVEWEIEAPTGEGHIRWEFDGEKLSRKSVTQEQTFDQHDANVQSLMKGSNSYDIRIRVDGQHVRITNGNGAALDDYTPDNPALHDLAGGRLSIKTPGEFKFSGEQQLMRSEIDLPEDQGNGTTSTLMLPPAEARWMLSSPIPIKAF